MVKWKLFKFKIQNHYHHPIQTASWALYQSQPNDHKRSLHPQALTGEHKIMNPFIS